MSNQQLLVFSSALLSGLVAYKLWKSQTPAKGLLPPSPRSYPIIGHLLSMPTEFEQLGFMKIGQQLNTNIFSLSAFGMTIIVLNDLQDAVELFEKRSAKYSDRTRPPMIAEPSLLDWENFGSVVGYNDRWRKYRRLMNPWLHKKAAVRFQPSQVHNTRLFLQRLVDKPRDYESLTSEVYSALASTLLSSIYGYELKSLEDPFLVDAREAMHHGEYAFLASNFAVNLIPALMYVPEWFPGAEWKKTARQWRLQKNRAVQGIFQWTKDQMKHEKEDETIVGAMMKQALSLDLNKEQVDDYVQEIAFTLFAGGADTSTASFMGFFMAMMLFPDVQAKAQKEIDTVVGSERLPEMEDQAQLPYVSRLVQEVRRWFPAVPLGVPHTCYESDEYKGYRIPKGAIVIGNIWAITRDANLYKDPETFDPDRFLDPSVPLSPSFGWGRRICPGQHFAEASLFIMIVSVLATFNIRMAQDQDGRDIIPSKKVTHSAIMYPEPFEFKLTPRSEKHKELIRSIV